MITIIIIIIIIAVVVVVAIVFIVVVIIIDINMVVLDAAMIISTRCVPVLPHRFLSRHSERAAADAVNVCCGL